MKQLFTTAVLLFSATAFAQVGINNTSPKATLDISPKTTDGSKPEGLLIPQLDGNTLKAAAYGTTQKGVIVYAKSAANPTDSKTINVTAEGYYYYDGSVWQKIVTGSSLNTTLASGNIYVGNASNVATSVAPTGDVTISNTGVTSIGAGKVTTSQLANNAVTVAKLPAGATGTTFLRGDGTWTTPANIYNTDGALTGPRTVNTAGNTLKISGGGALTVQGSDTAGKVLLTPASDATQTGFMSILKGDNTRLGYIGWDNTNLLYKTENGANHIFDGGNVGIGTTTPSASLEIKNASGFPALKVNNLNSQPVNSNAAYVTVDNVTGEFYKGSQSEKVFYYQIYNINNVNGDWINNFDTKISTTDYTVIVVGSYFNQMLGINNGNTTLNRFTPQNVFAFKDTVTNTWRLTADFPGVTSKADNASDANQVPNGKWTIYTMILRNNQVIKNNDINIDLGGTNTGAATSSPVP